MVGALSDDPKEFIFDGGPAWRPEKALDAAYHGGWEQAVPEMIDQLSAAMQPATRLWIGQRLASLFVLFNPTRDVDDRAFTLWNDEMTRLLVDIPHDILAEAIDDAIRKSAHGFMPSVGEIRRHADPRHAERREQIARLGRMKAALEDAEATAERTSRREQQEAHHRDMARPEQ